MLMEGEGRKRIVLGGEVIGKEEGGRIEDVRVDRKAK
jgi:hypothetical protein